MLQLTPGLGLVVTSIGASSNNNKKTKNKTKSHRMIHFVFIYNKIFVVNQHGIKKSQKNKLNASRKSHNYLFLIS